MGLPEFKYFQPNTVGEALDMLAAQQGEAALVAGGTDLIIKLKRRLANFRCLIDLKGINELNGITSGADKIEIGALTKLSTIESSSEVKNGAPLLAKAASLVGGPQHRSMGTLGGNICLDTSCYYYNQSHNWRQSRPPCFKTGGDRCYVAKNSPECHAVYSGDTAPALIAQNARIRVASPDGTTEDLLENLYSNNGKNPVKIKMNSIITAVIIPKSSPNTGFAYEKFRLREAVDFPVVGVAAAITLDSPGGICTQARIILNAIGTAPQRVQAAESVLIGRKVAEAVEDVAKVAYEAARPIHKMGGSPYYKKKMVRVLTRRAIAEAGGII